jgi:fatty-acyl-CoA synthase
MPAAAEVWVDDLTIGRVLQQTVDRVPDQDAVVFPQLGLKLSWREFQTEVDATARGLLALGIKPGEHVAVWATNVPQWITLQFATARMGAVLVTINPANRAFELQFVLQQSDAVALFLIDHFKTSNYFEMLSSMLPELEARVAAGINLDETAPPLATETFPKLRQVVSMLGTEMSDGEANAELAGAHNWDQMLTAGERISIEVLEESAAQLKPSDPINIQYTSGTTGFPKAAMLSHRNLLMNAFYIGQCQQLSGQDRICIPVPFYHCFGCVLGTLAAAVYGAAMIIPAAFFDPQATLAAIEEERATAIYGVPTMFIAELAEVSIDERDLSSLRTGIMAGSPCPIEVMRKVIDRMGARQMTIAYGQTEASPVVTQTRTDDPLELRVETVGRAIPQVEIKIIDPATGSELGDNEQGELCSRGHVVMLGYYNNPEATREAIDDEGWLHSGDLAIRLSNGYFRITGRIKDMVIRGGENIYPREIEEFLFTHPSIEQSAVVGVPDPKYGEALCVWVKCKSDRGLTEEDVRDFCRDNLAHFKVPRYVRFVDEFPQTVTGKIQKFKIRETMIAELGLAEPPTA